MRKIVCLLDVERHDGRVIAQDALKMVGDTVPVVWNGTFHDIGKLMGLASDLQIDGNEASMKIEPNEQYKTLMENDLDYYVFATDLVERDNQVLSANIRAISVYSVAGNPSLE